jgi:hypothetical protein
MKLFLSIALLVLAVSIPAQDIGYLRSKAADLSAPAMRGRGYVDKGVERAADYIADEFEAIGLEPLSKNYRQSFKHNVNTFPGDVSITIAGNQLQAGKDFLVEANSPSFKGKYRAEVIAASELLSRVSEASPFKACQDCVIVIEVSGDESKEVRSEAYQLREMLRKTQPVIWSSEDKLTWSVGTFQALFPIIEMQSGLVKQGDIVTVNICAKEKQGFESENVIGMVKGRVHPDSFLVFTAHYDHLGMMGKEATFYGANDNASGTAYILSMAKHYVAQPADYSCVFIAFAGEEAGLVGSKYFVDHPLIDLKSIRFLINLDLMGSGIDGITVVNAPAVQSDFDILRSINEEQSFLPKINSRKQTANSDHYYFAEAGVPAVFIYALGGSTAYHDIFDVNANLTFDEYEDIFRLLTDWVAKF